MAQVKQVKVGLARVLGLISKITASCVYDSDVFRKLTPARKQAAEGLVKLVVGAVLSQVGRDGVRLVQPESPKTRETWGIHYTHKGWVPSAQGVTLLGCLLLTSPRPTVAPASLAAPLDMRQRALEACLAHRAGFYEASVRWGLQDALCLPASDVPAVVPCAEDYFLGYEVGRIVCLELQRLQIQVCSEFEFESAPSIACAL